MPRSIARAGLAAATTALAGVMLAAPAPACIPPPQPPPGESGPSFGRTYQNVHQERAAAERRLRDLRRHLDELTDNGFLSDVDITLRSVPAQPFLAYRTTVDSLAVAFDLVTEVVAVASRSQRPGPAVVVVVVVVAHGSVFDEADLNLEVGFTVSRPASLDLGAGRRMSVGQLPAVERMVSIVYRGSGPDGYRRCHHALGLWLDRHGCRLAGPGREILHDPGSPEHPGTVEIQYPVTNREPTDQVV